MAASPLDPHHAANLFTATRYTDAWEMGTGLLVALPPGVYRITGRERHDGRSFLRLDETWRIDAPVSRR